MNKTKAGALIAFGVFWAFLDWKFGKGHWFGWLGMPIGFYGLYRMSRRLSGELNLKAIRIAHAELDCMAGGLRILGSESEMIDWRRTDNRYEPGPIQGMQLCRTRKGRWFQFSFDVEHGRAHVYSVKALDEAEARSWLSYNVHKYEQVFGALEVA